MRTPRSCHAPTPGDAAVDVLMITHRRPSYVRHTLPRLLDTADARTRIWVWHNGDDAETLAAVRAHLGHPRLHRFHHSPENRLVVGPTNWLLGEAEGDLLGVVADDCLAEPGWIEALRAAHAAEPRLGVLACWHWHPDDFDPALAARKIRTLAGGVRVMTHPWTQGSGVLLKRACLDATGLIPDDERGFTSHCRRIAEAGWINGWLVPIVPIEHLDDPRSPLTLLRTDADLAQHLPLSARLRGVRTVADWRRHLERAALAMQVAPSDPRQYRGWRSRLRRLHLRLTRGDLVLGRVPARRLEAGGWRREGGDASRRAA